MEKAPPTPAARLLAGTVALALMATAVAEAVVDLLQPVLAVVVAAQALLVWQLQPQEHRIPAVAEAALE